MGKIIIFNLNQIDLQWLVITCDPARPLRQSCDEIPVGYLSLTMFCPYFITTLSQGYAVASSGPEEIFGTPPAQPCQTCPAGPRGEKVNSFCHIFQFFFSFLIFHHTFFSHTGRTCKILTCFL